VTPGEAVIEKLHVVPADRILDLGCGDGASSRRLARLASGGLAIGVDTSDDMVRLARRLSVDIENLMFVLGSPEEIPWQEDFFSKVLRATSNETWPHSERAAREIFRVVAPGGLVFALGSEWENDLAAAGFCSIQSHPTPAGILIEGRKP